MTNRRITTNETVALVLALVAGLMLGAIFFGGLWWTIGNAVSSDRPALWFFGSLLARMCIVLAGFFLIARSHRWQSLVTCLVGFVLARLIVTWLTRPHRDDNHRPFRHCSHAS